MDDKELIDRGFAFVARSVYIEAATRALLNSKSSDEGVREWARWVLEGLPANVPNAQGNEKEEATL